MTPAVKALTKACVEFELHRYDSDVNNDAGWGAQAASALGLDARIVFKTLVIATAGAKSEFAVAVLPVSRQLDLRAAAAALGAKKAQLADPVKAERLTGYVTGGISPFGQRRSLPLILDRSATECATVHVSGGRRGLEIELKPDALLSVTAGIYADIVRR